MTNRKPKHVGIVGCSAEGAALCYKTICVESGHLLGEHHHPEVSMHTHSLADYVRLLESGDTRGVAELMLSSASKLASAGAEFVICPDNTIHQAYSLVEQVSPVPWLHIAQVVVTEAKQKKYKKLGILGTQWLVESDFYPTEIEKAGMDWLRPGENEKKEIDRIIMHELVNGVLKEDSIAYFQHIIRHLKRDGCDAVILGCTEIPLIICDANSPLPTLNSNRLLAEAAIQYSINVS